ncbi:MAG: DJ-1/PfpI family protein [Thermoanaerobaculia bacterium]
MKTTHGMAICLVLALCAITFAREGRAAGSEAASQATSKWRCPMEDHTALFDKPGNCPQCGMALVETDKQPPTVAFVITPNANVIDFSGPWEVFQDASFRLYSVSDGTDPVVMTGGLKVVPAHTFADAPKPDIVVVGAQSGSPAMLEWLKKVSESATVMSVCTGAFKLGKAGLLDGHPATTHHDFFNAFEKQFPNVKLQRGLRWVQSSERVYTAGGLTSGIDLALHLVAKTLGEETARQEAFYMEHSGNGWKDPAATPVKAQPR